MADNASAAGASVAGRPVVVFDFDGTLADTKGAIVRTATEVLLAHGLGEGELGDVGRIVGPPFPQAFSLVYGLSQDEALSITHDYRKIYERMGLEAWPLFPGMRELLERLRGSGRRLAVASSKREPLLRRGLCDNGIEGVFELVVGNKDDGNHTKAKALAEVMAVMGVGAEDCVMVGDRLYDVEGALACGMPCVGVELGNTAAPGELAEAGACAVVGSVEELGRVLVG
ncbi:HAD family hydrolase [Olsenella urininfantis]|uniref:HAD family hydrolase n=1 Tax=Olsenella urininfantis TaxID=1871033 RepID=UPI0009842431|nr:HAD hydrolase-like protein [Olsenella urininfantis]